MLFGKEHIFRKLTMEKESKSLLAIIFFVVAIGVVLVVLVFLVDLSAIVDKETEATIISIVGGVIAIVGLILFYQRLKKQEEQIDLQRKQRTDDRFTTAVELLGSSETSARTGAIYSLYHLAIEDKKYRKEVSQILCSHIRSKTNEADYKKEHNKRPSNEIQSTIDLLLKNQDGNKGLYCQDFAKEKSFPQANFKYAYLVKANFRSAQCQGANFSCAQCQGANFTFAQCQGAYFNHAQCQGAYFIHAKCQGADFSDAQCQGAYFLNAKCQGADFNEAQCQGAYFRFAQCQGAYFRFAQCQGADFRSAQCQGANFSEAQCQGAYFIHAKCQGAYTCDGYYIEFKDLIGKETELKTMQFAGELNKEAIKNIEVAKNYLSDRWYQKMQKIIKDNKGKKADYTIPKGIITDELADNTENRAIAEKLEKIKEQKEKLKEKLWENIYKNEK